MTTATNEELLELNRRIIEAMPGGIVHVGANGAIQTANAEALRILGLSFDALTRTYVKDFDTQTVWEDGTHCAAADYPVSRALTTGRPQAPVVIGVRKPDGETSWALFTAVPIFVPSSTEVAGAVVTFLDITRRKQAEAALARSEGLLRSVLESAPTPIVTTDLEGTIDGVMNTLASEASAGVKIWSRVGPEDQGKVRAAFERSIEEGVNSTYEVTASSGRRWLVHAGPRRAAGAIVGATFVSTDVTELRELEARLAITDRMASIGTLVAGVAHEINNPLTYLLTSLDWLRAQTEGLAPRARELLANALEGAERIRTVVADLGSFSRSGGTEGKPVELRPLIDGALRIARNEIRHRARVNLSWATIPEVWANEGRLGQVFLNLLVNAAQAIPEGSTEQNEISIAGSTDELGRAVVEITDTGSGIAPSLVGRIFDPFVTTKPRGVGTGLGLYISRNVVTDLGGELTVRSVVGKGTTFRVVLPPAGPGTTGAVTTRSSPRAVTRRLRILVADDDAAIGRVLRAIFDGHEVHLTTSGRDALERLKTEDFDVVFCDLVMSDLTGVDVYEQLKAIRPGREARIVFMTGGAFTPRTRGFVGSVPNQVLHKPFSAEQVLAAAAAGAEA